MEINRMRQFGTLFWKELLPSYLFLCGLCAETMAQSTLQGIILDDESRESIPEATLHLMPLNRGTVSNPWGRFAFEDLEPGTYTLEVRHLGFKEHTEKIMLEGQQTLNLRIMLIPEVRSIEGIEVTDYAEEVTDPLKIPYIRSVVTKDQIFQSSATDIGTFLRAVPNVSGIRKGGSTIDPVIRGFKYGQLNVQIDHGQKVEGGCPNRMDPALSHVEIEDLEGIGILKGPYSFRYGTSFGGVLNLRTQKPALHDRFEVSGSALLGYTGNPAGTREHLTISGGNRFLCFGLSGNHKENGNYRDGNGNSVKSENHRYGIRGQLGISPVRQHNLLLSYSYSVGRNVSYPALPMDMREDETRLMSLDYTWDRPSRRVLPVVLKIYRSEVNHEMDNKDRPSSDTVVAVTTVRAINTGGRIESGFISGNHSLLSGIDVEHIAKDGDRVKTLIMQPTMPVYTEQIWNNAVITNLGWFSEYKYSISTLDLIVSGRLDYNQANSDAITFEKMGSVLYFNDDNRSEFLNFSISTGAVYHLNEHLDLGLMMGRGVRSPDMTERFITLLPVGYDNYDYLGNPSLRPEANNQVDLTGRWHDPDLGNLEINGFYSFIADYITARIVPPAEQRPATNGVIGVKKFYNADLARFRGFELAYGSPASKKWILQLVASWTCATIDEAVRHVISPGGEVTGTEVIQNDPLAEIPPFESTVIAGYSFLHGKLLPRVKGRFVARQDHVSQAFYEKATPGFFLAGISLSYYHNEHFTVSGGIDNLFDREYHEHLNRRVIGSPDDLNEPGRNFYINLLFSF